MLKCWNWTNHAVVVDRAELEGWDKIILGVGFQKIWRMGGKNLFSHSIPNFFWPSHPKKSCHLPTYPTKNIFATPQNILPWHPQNICVTHPQKVFATPSPKKFATPFSNFFATHPQILLPHHPQNICPLPHCCSPPPQQYVLSSVSTFMHDLSAFKKCQKIHQTNLKHSSIALS